MFATDMKQKTQHYRISSNTVPYCLQLRHWLMAVSFMDDVTGPLERMESHIK